jgi:hypothetical protein
MILSKLIFDNTQSSNIVKISFEDMCQIIKNEAKIDKFLSQQTLDFRRDEIE